MEHRRPAVIILLLSATVMVALTWLPFSWAGWALEACALRNCYCEPVRNGYFVLQPVTALSNLGYVLVGALILAASATQRGNPLAQGRRFARWLGGAAIITGWASYLSHASLTRAGEWLDLMGVYQVLLALLVYSLHRWSGRTAVGLYGAALLVLGAQMILAPAWQQIVIGVLLAAWVVVEGMAQWRMRPRANRRFAAAAAALFASGAAIWSWYGRAPVCAPGEFPWHVAWHLLSAAAIGCLYWYYRSEDLPNFRS